MLTSPRSIVVIRSLSHAKYSRAKSDCAGEGMLKQIRLIAVWETRVDNFQKLCQRRQRVVQIIPVNRFSPVQTLPFAIKRNVGLIADVTKAIGSRNDAIRCNESIKTISSCFPM